jgi:histidinol-phosphate/aromatic aminotransferase/cobyric acid decarboxylase-like protein
MLGNKEVVAQISATLIPWNVGTIPMWAALAALEDTEALEKRIKFNNEQVKYIERELGGIPGMTVFHSRGNYILLDAKGTGKTGDDIVAYAQEKDIILRPQNKMYDSDGFFRITIGTEEENKIMVKAIKEFCAK